jgi:fatty-acyl-CoA synthase
MPLLERASIELRSLGLLARTGVLAPRRPDRVLAGARDLRRYGPLGGGVAAAAHRDPDRIALVDERGSLTFADLDRRANALANSLRSLGAGGGTGIAILCRNHRGFLESTIAASRIGARALYLNTDFAGPQIRDVCAREGAELLIYDQEFGELVTDTATPLGRVIAWHDDDPGEPTVEGLIAAGDPSPPDPPDEDPTVIMLTSGTTGTPRGAPRESPSSLAPVGALLSKVPLRAREATHVAAPVFHALGFAHAVFAVSFGSTLVLRRRFDPEAALAAVAEHGCTALIVVPVMLQRILALPEEVRRAHDVSSLRILFCGGSQLEGDVASRALEEFGDVVYNLYGSTEVAYATIATPEDLRAAPGCAGRPPLGTQVKILDDAGHEVPAGRTGRIFVGNTFQFEGYTGGGTKEVIDGLMSTGDVGHIDAGGRLFVDGRDDEMIVSGGENVFPREIEELLASHEEIEEAAAVGVPDDEFGQVLRAFVVRRPDSRLDEDAVRAYVKQNLARYKVPRQVEFIDQLPRNPTGKVLKRRLAAEHVGLEG